MKRFLRTFYRALVMFGIDPLATLRAFRGFPAFLRDFRALKQQQAASARKFPIGMFRPCLSERYVQSGFAQGHYFHQDLLVARRIYLNCPQRHVDVGSRIDGFVAHVAAFRPIEVIDIRPQRTNVPNIAFLRADMMGPLSDSLVACCDSLSSLHVMEHFGLGRYGDPIEYDGYLPGIENLHRMLKIGGKLYFSVPIGPLRIEFNAHRVFSVSYLLECFQGSYQLDAFSFVDDNGYLHEDVVLSDTDVQSNCGCNYGCGILELTKR